jgi:hypothetical protein
MAVFRKKTDPLSDRSRALNAQIADLEAKIKKLSQNLEKRKTEQPLLRSSAYPSGQRVEHPPAAATPDLVFEETDHSSLEAQAEETPSGNGQLQVRKHHVGSWLEKFQHRFRKPPPVNPKLISYLAAGSFQGLPPLRYEKRVARNRVLLLFVVFLILLLGIFAIFYTNH